MPSKFQASSEIFNKEQCAYLIEGLVQHTSSTKMKKAMIDGMKKRSPLARKTTQGLRLKARKRLLLDAFGKKKKLSGK